MTVTCPTVNLNIIFISSAIAQIKPPSKNANKNWKQSDPYEYYKANNRNAANGVEFIEFCIKAVLDKIYVDISRYGIDTVAKLIRENYYSKFYNNKKDKDGNEILDWLTEYNKLVNKYYKED